MVRSISGQKIGLWKGTSESVSGFNGTTIRRRRTLHFDFPILSRTR
jgi:hypothetical protein